jgi:hypothetical protein
MKSEEAKLQHDARVSELTKRHQNEHKAMMAQQHKSSNQTNNQHTVNQQAT